MKSPRSSLASRYSVAFILCLSCLMVLIASAISVSRTSPLAAASLASSARAEASATPRSTEPFAPVPASPLNPTVNTTVTATKTHTPAGNRAPGDTLTYTVVITNTGANDAAGVFFTDTIDPNTMFVPNSLLVSPIAVNDSYNTIGNVNISVPAGQGLLVNDLNPGGMGTLAITAFDAASANGGTVTVNTTDGSFTYNPAAGFRGPTDTFTYTLGNGTGKTDTATVTININGMIWFVNNDPAAPGSAPGDGRLTNPFRSFGGASSFNTIATDAAGDSIFVYTGTSTYTGGVTLLNTQKLIGQGAGDTLLNISGLSGTPPSGTNLLPMTGGTNPTIAAAVDNITLGSNNTVRGVTLNVTAVGATALTGSGFGTLTLAETTIGGTNGRALSLTTGTLSGPVSSTAAFTSISSTNSSLTGMTLTSVAGKMSSGSTTITNSSGIGISVNTSSAALSFGTTSSTGSSGTGISLLTNTGTITFGALTITPDANQRGLLATDNTNTITIPSGTITNSGAGAVEITRVGACCGTTTPLAISLTLVSSSGGSTAGIVLTNTSGSFAVTGDGGGSNNGSGGTITLKSGGTNGTDGVTLTNAAGVSLGYMNISSNTQNGIKATSLVGITINRCNITSNSDQTTPDEAGLYLLEVTGTNNITNTTISNSFESDFRIENSSGTSTDNVTNCTISNNGASTQAANLFNFLGTITANMTLNLSNTTITGNRVVGMLTGFGLEADTSGGTLVANVSGCSFTNNAVGMSASIGGNANVAHLTFDFHDNPVITGTDGTAINFSANANSLASDTINGKIRNNVIGTSGVLNSGSLTGNGISVDNESAATANVLVTGNTVQEIKNTDGVTTGQVVSAGTLNVTVTNNTIDKIHGGSGANIFGINSFVTFAGATECANISGNTLTNITGVNAPQKLRVRQAGGASTFKCTQADINALAAANGITAAEISQIGTITYNQPACSQPPAAPDFGIASLQDKAAPVNDTSKDTLFAPRGEGAGGDQVRKLTQAELSAMVQAALERWRQAGISFEDLARLQAVTFEITDLPGGQIATGSSSRVQVDDTGAGYGWYFDEFPMEDGEFDLPVPGKELQTTEYSPAHGKMDLLTVVMRELGEVYLQAGKRIPKTVRKRLQPLMDSTLSPSVRRLPDPSAIQIQQSDPSSFTTQSHVAPAQHSSQQTTGSSTGGKGGNVATLSRLSPQSGETVSQNLGTIPVGEKVTLMFQVTINNPLPANVCTVTNPATGSGVNVTGSNFTSVTIAPDTATIVKPPTIGACPTDITKNTDAGLCTAVATFTTPTSDACPAATVTCVPASGFAFPKGITTVTCTAANGNPPDSTCMFTVTVNDNQAPVFSGCTNITTNTAPGLCTAAPTFAPTATDNCDGVRPVTCNPTSGSTFAKGVTTVTCMSSDLNTPMANTSSCMFTVTVTDNQAPVVTCPPAGGAFAASDCLPSQRSAYTGATLYSTGGNTVTNVVLFGFSPCTAPPVSGSATINFTGTLTGDITIPPSSLTHFQAPVTGSMKVTFNNLTGSTRTFDTEMLQLDLSGGNLPAGVLLRESPTQTSTGQTKITTVTGGFHIDSFFDVFTELSTNSGATFTPDGAGSPRHISAVQSTDTDACTAVVNYPAATATDNCDTVTPNCAPASGTTFAKGVTTVTCSATDTSNLTGNCTFTVTVVDTQLPTLTCPNNISVTTPGGCQNVNYTNPTPSDNCPSPTINCSPMSGTCFAVGTTTVTCTATDTSGNTNSCSFTVSVIPCTITCPNNITDNTAPGTCAHVETFADPTTTGTCGTVTCSPVSGSSFPKGVTTVTCSTAAGPSCTFTVTINDNEAPTITCPNPITQNTDPNLCTAVVSFTPTVNDNCPGATPSCSPASGSVFPKGVTDVTCHATDTSNNMSQPCTFTVTVVDNQAPTVACPANISKNTDLNLCTAVATYVTPTGSDNCAVQSVVCSPTSGTAFAKGVTTVTCTVTDTANLTGTCTFTVTVVDNQAPTVTCPAPITQNTDPGVCTSVVTYTTPTGSDNCPLPPNPVVCSPASGTAFAKGITTVTCTVTDAANLTGNCMFTVTVVDNQAPTVTCPAPVTQNTDLNLCSAIVNYTTPTGSDNCPLGPNPVVCSPASGSVFPKGTTTVTCTVTDSSNLTGNCMFTVTVNDNQPPTVTCPANISQAAASNQCSAVVTYSNATATDNCAVSGSPVCAPASGSTFQKGVTTVTCTVSDTSNNVGSCTFTVTITDTQPPVITCPAPVTHGTDPGVCNAVVTYPNATATDNCSGVGTPVCTPASGTTFAKGVTTVTCNVTDASSNPASCTFTVTVNDTQNPTVTCPNNINFTTPGNNDPCGVVTYATPSGSDNCGVQSVVCTPPSGTCFLVGMTTVTCTATDTSGNQGSCTFKVIVSNPCTITCPPDQMAFTGPGATQCGTVVTYPAPTTTGGGCGTVACSPASGSLFPVGMTTVTCTTNGPSCSFKVTVFDNTPPVFPNCPGITMTAQPSCPFATSTAVSFATPAATDNCPGTPTVTCIPPAGSQFPVGTTTVTCTATDAANNTAQCTFGVNVFSFCLQDDSSPGNVVFVNAITGDYLFCSSGVAIASGRGTLTVRGCQFDIDHTKGNRKVHIGGDTSANNGAGAGIAVIQKTTGPMIIQITDKNMSNNTCSCSSVPPPANPRDPDPGKRINGN